jgi:hypothetical protein
MKFPIGVAARRAKKLSEGIQPGASIDTVSINGNRTISSVTSKP